jgi:hypothetical protein
MAVNVRQLFPLQKAKERRIEFGRYLRLDGGRHLIAAALLLAFMSLISLGQTGRLAAQGHEISVLQDRKTVLQRERSDLLLRLSKAQSFNGIERRAKDLNLKPVTDDQVRYITLDPALREASGESQTQGSAAITP